ncbi:hypothetical protein SLA2020_127700 [Shorea laevis]
MTLQIPNYDKNSGRSFKVIRVNLLIPRLLYCWVRTGQGRQHLFAGLVKPDIVEGSDVEYLSSMFQISPRMLFTNFSL